MELKFAHYPFTSSASRYVERSNRSLESLVDGGEFGKAVMDRGEERVIQSIEGEIRKSFGDGVLAEIELFSYPLARILVSCIDDHYLIRRYALAEATSAHAQMKRETLRFLGELGEEFGIEHVVYGRDFKIHFTDYLPFASRVRDPKWKLVNRRLDNGYVMVSREEFTRLLQEAVRNNVQNALPLDVPKSVCNALSPYITEIRQHLEKRKSEFKIGGFAEVDSDCFPPCIRHLLMAIQTGQNLAHSARFALTSFLANIGMGADEIVDTYRASLDFDEERTRYQVQHIVGSSGTAYTAPSCATMATYGNCVGKEPMCNRVSHPLSFYRKKWYLDKNMDKGAECEKAENL